MGRPKKRHKQNRLEWGWFSCHFERLYESIFDPCWIQVHKSIYDRFNPKYYYRGRKNLRELEWGMLRARAVLHWPALGTSRDKHQSQSSFSVISRGILEDEMLNVQSIVTIQHLGEQNVAVLSRTNSTLGTHQYSNQQIVCSPSKLLL